MAAENCARCGRVFNSFGKKVCPECEKHEDVQFQQVRDYIEENAEHTLKDIVANTNVPAKRILKFIREGRLIVSRGLAAEVVCEKCGDPITTGRYCESCILKLSQEVDQFVQKNKPMTAEELRTGKMHLRKKL